MGGKKKWIHARRARAATPIARQALASRLNAAWNYFCLAATQPDGNVEHVHQARVWSRRSLAAMAAFDDFLPRRRRKWFSRWLRRMRQAAGEARDDDVLAARLSSLAAAAGGSDDGAAWLLESVLAHRRKAQRPLEKLHGRLKRKFPRQLKKLVRSVRWRGRGRAPNFSVVCRTQLRLSVDRFFCRLDGDLATDDALHELRLCAKRLRYAMEVTSAGFPAALRMQAYPQVEELQQRLGDINDHAVARQRFDDWHSTTSHDAARATLGQMALQEAERLSTARRTLFEWWTPERAAHLRGVLEELLQDRTRARSASE